MCGDKYVEREVRKLELFSPATPEVWVTTKKGEKMVHEPKSPELKILDLSPPRQGDSGSTGKTCAMKFEV
jgi:hypothetical protein